VTVRLLDDDGAVAEHVVLVGRDDRVAAVLERRIGLGSCAARRIRSEHRVVLDLRHEPVSAREQVRVGRVIPVIVRQREVRHVGGLVAGCRELRNERLCELDEPLLAVAAQQPLFDANRADALVIGHGASVPHQHAARVDDEIRRDRQRYFLDVGIGEAITRRLGGEHAAVEHVDARGGDRAAVALGASGG
jgi:hypothetical protein